MKQWPNHRAVWRIAAPMTVSNISVPLLGIVDTAVVGHLPGPHYLGAVGIGAAIFSFIFMGFNFLRMATTGLTAQALGREDHYDLRATLFRALIISLGLSVLLLVLQYPISVWALELMQPEATVGELAQGYFNVRIYSAPAVLANFALLGWFLGLHNARVPLMLLLVINGVNMALDWLFVVHLNMGVPGVAWASVIGEYLGLIYALAAARRELYKRPAGMDWSKLFDHHAFRELLSVNVNILIRTLCLVFSLSFFTAQSSRFGPVVLAANVLLMNFSTFMAYGLDGLANAAEALVGRAIGMGDLCATRRAVLLSLVWSVFIALMICGFYALFGTAIIRLLTNIPEVRAQAMAYLPWVIVLPIISVWSFLFDGVFIGATRAREMRDTMVFSVLLVYLPVWYLLRPWGNQGLWLAFALLMAARGASMAWVYCSLLKKNRLISR